MLISDPTMRFGQTIAVALVFGLLVSISVPQPAHAFDGAKPLSEQNASPMEAFEYGFKAYRQGETETAVDALKFAAGKGSAMAQWKLGRMYARGDGVPVSPLTAFEFFRDIVNAHQDIDPNADDAPFVANALVELGTYFEQGIPGTYVTQQPVQARQIYAYAASYYGDPLAQYSLAKMYLDGRGGSKDARQAARWLKLSAEKGHLLAQSELGRILFFGEGVREKPRIGLKWLTIALSRAQGPEADHIRALHEQAFANASERMRRYAARTADEWIAANPEVIFAAAPLSATTAATTAPNAAQPAAVVSAPLESLTDISGTKGSGELRPAAAQPVAADATGGLAGN